VCGIDRIYAHLVDLTRLITSEPNKGNNTNRDLTTHGCHAVENNGISFPRLSDETQRRRNAAIRRGAECESCNRIDLELVRIQFFPYHCKHALDHRRPGGRRHGDRIASGNKRSTCHFVVGVRNQRIICIDLEPVFNLLSIPQIRRLLRMSQPRNLGV
jgi:hypothetical protein